MKQNSRKNRREGKRKTFHYLIGVLGLVLLIGGAFMGPQMVFQAGDYYLWQGTALSERETMDITMLTTTYEQSLPVRLKNFAEGLEKGEQYYVTFEDLEVTQEIVQKYHESCETQYGDFLVLMLELELFPFNNFVADITVNSCRQYVIYSDNYAKGVNFIIWCLEIESMDGMTMRLLMDAEDGALYAMKFDGFEAMMKLNPHYKFLFDDRLEQEYEELRIVLANIFCDYYCRMPENMNAVTDTREIYYERMRLKEEENVFLLEIPFGEYFLEFDIRPLENYWAETVIVDAEGEEVREKIDSTWSYLPVFPKFVSGIRSIYRMIPEFAEEFFTAEP